VGSTKPIGDGTMTPSRLVPAVVRAARSLLRACGSERRTARDLGISQSGLRSALSRGTRKTISKAGRPRGLTVAQRSRLLKFVNAENRKGRPTAALIKRTSPDRKFHLVRVPLS